MQFTRVFSIDLYLAERLLRRESPNVSPELLTDYRRFIASMLPKSALPETVRYLALGIEQRGWCDLCRDYRKVAILQLSFDNGEIDLRSLLDDPEEVVSR